MREIWSEVVSPNGSYRNPFPFVSFISLWHKQNQNHHKHCCYHHQSFWEWSYFISLALAIDFLLQNDHCVTEWLSCDCDCWNYQEPICMGTRSSQNCTECTYGIYVQFDMDLDIDIGISWYIPLWIFMDFDPRPGILNVGISSSRSFLAVQNSSIGDLVTDSLSDILILTLQSDPRDL